MNHGPSTSDAPAAPWAAPTPRALHARMLAFAATRRRAAEASLRRDWRVEALYWKSCAPEALGRARAVRICGLAALP